MIYNPFLLCMVLLGLVVGCFGGPKPAPTANREVASVTPPIQKTKTEQKNLPKVLVVDPNSGGSDGSSASQARESLTAYNPFEEGLYSSSLDGSDSSEPIFLDKVEKFLEAWQKIGKQAGARELAALFKKSNLEVRGGLSWAAIKSSFGKAGGPFSNASQEVLQAVDQIDKLITATTALAEANLKKLLSEEFIEESFVTVLGGQGNDLATIPAVVEKAIGELIEILQNETNHISKKRRANQQNFKISKAIANQMVQYLELLKEFLTPIQPENV